ncbi:MAG: hypothetical protein ACRENS_02420, partial [Candidatus Eiseniibacteriota bacterium]
MTGGLVLCALLFAGIARASEAAAPADSLPIASASSAAWQDSLPIASASSAAWQDSLPAMGDSSTTSDPPEDAPADRDYEVERERPIAPSEIEMGYSLASRAGGRVSQRRRVRVRENYVEAEVREGRGDALAGAVLGTRVPGGWLALGRASPLWGRGMVVGAPAEPWRAHALASPAATPRPREGDAVEFRHLGRFAVDLMAARQRHDEFAALQLGARAAALEFALTRALEDRGIRGLGGLRLSGAGAEAEAAIDARGAWRLEA